MPLLRKGKDARVVTLSSVEVANAQADLKIAVKDADYIVLATPHTPQTERMIDGEIWAATKRGVVFVNIARGQVVEVGVFAAQPRRYALEHWWTTSEGAKGVLYEAIALAWTTCCFTPPAPDRGSVPAPRSPA